MRRCSPLSHTVMFQAWPRQGPSVPPHTRSSKVQIVETNHAISHSMRFFFLNFLAGRRKQQLLCLLHDAVSPNWDNISCVNGYVIFCPLSHQQHQQRPFPATKLHQKLINIHGKYKWKSESGTRRCDRDVEQEKQIVVNVTQQQSYRS